MRFITLNENNKIVAERHGPSIVVGEIQSDIGELGQIMQPDGTFIDDVIVPSEPQETQFDRIENTLDILLLKQEGII